MHLRLTFSFEALRVNGQINQSVSIFSPKDWGKKGNSSSKDCGRLGGVMICPSP